MKSQKIKIYVFTLGKVKILVCAFFYSLHLKNKSKTVTIGIVHRMYRYY